MQQSMPNWDLSDLYTAIDDTKLKADIAEVLNGSQRFALEVSRKVIKYNAEELYNAIVEYERIVQIITKIQSFAFLYYTTRMDEEEASIFFQNVNETMMNAITSLIFFPMEINEISDTRMSKLLKSSSNLNKYASWIRDARIFKPYQLSFSEEVILHEKSITSSDAWVRFFDETIDKLRFPFMGKLLTCSEITEKLSNTNRAEREEAGHSIADVLRNNAHTFVFIMNVIIKDKAISDNFRQFETPISSRNLSNFIEDDIVKTLISTVKQNYANLSHRYYKFKAKIMGLEKLSYWDRNAPLEEVQTIIKWPDAVNIVLEAYNAFSSELGDVAKAFFDNAWIDVPMKKGKRTGAFAHPTIPSAHPYLMLNYAGKIGDVMTLAHELGHGVHMLLSNKHGVLMNSAPLTLAETASVFGEQLVFRYILNNEGSKIARRNLIAKKVEDMINTVVRQIAFCDFEIKLHDARKNGELSAEFISQTWMEVSRESLGSGIELLDEYKYYWAYIPHIIHSPFYVYSYAFGDCLVNSLYKMYLDGNVQNFQAKYMEMLRAGGTLHHRELLKPFKISINEPTFWQKGLNVISEFIDMLEKEM